MDYKEVNNNSNKSNIIKGHPCADCSIYTKNMYEKWAINIRNIPAIDQHDILRENPHFNGQRIRAHNHQHNPEFTHSSYLRLRTQEEAFLMFDYLNPEQNTAFASYLKQFYFENSQSSEMECDDSRSSQKKKKLQIVSQFDRSYAIQKIFHLHFSKEYKIETLFVASGIFDRYLAMIGHWNFPRDQICALATISLLLAAKVEQPISPSYTRMINILSEEEQQTLTKQKLVQLESDILVRFGFDFNFPGPIQSMERYLRILNYDFNKIVYDISYQICKFQLNDSKFLIYRPSQIAACSVIISINIYKRDQEKYIDEQSKKSSDSSPFDKSKNSTNSEFFSYSDKTKIDADGKEDKLLLFNLDIWNNLKIYNLTGYYIEMLKRPLYELSVFIINNLSPNRLEGFDVESITKVANFYEVEEAEMTAGTNPRS